MRGTPPSCSMPGMRGNKATAPCHPWLADGILVALLEVFVVGITMLAGQTRPDVVIMDIEYVSEGEHGIRHTRPP